VRSPTQLELAHTSAVPEKKLGLPVWQSAGCAEDLIYISICSGGPLIKLARPSDQTLFADNSLFSGLQSSL
jgi:hypothetical protein